MTEEDDWNQLLDDVEKFRGRKIDPMLRRYIVTGKLIANDTDDIEL